MRFVIDELIQRRLGRKKDDRGQVQAETDAQKRDSARGVAGEEHAAYPCPALPFSGCLIDHEHENDHEHDQITIRRRYSGSGA